MAENSRPWEGIVTGDSGPYSDDQWAEVWATLLGPVIANEGVFIDQPTASDALSLSGLPATPISIGAGLALVDGSWYENTAAVSVSLAPLPLGNPRVDRIVLRKDWALQTIRITRLVGAEAAGPVPLALTQIADTTWELPLWQVHVTVPGVITVWRDERTFIGQYVPVGVTDERVYLEEEFFLPATAMVTGDVFNSFGIIIVANGIFNVFPAFGRGAGTLRITGAGATNVVDIRSRDHRPELIDAHLIMRSKQPNTDAELDRVLGFLDSAISLTPTNGVFFRSNGVGNWFAVCRAGGVEAGSVTDTGQTLDDVWRKFEIRQTSTDVVVFLIDDVVVAQHQVNIPTADLMLRVGIFDSGAGTAGVADYMNVDLMRLTGDRS